MAEIGNLSPSMTRHAEQIVAGGIDADEVLRLRKDVFGDGIVSRDEAKLLFYLNERAGHGNDEAWDDFFVEALSTYFVWKQEPVGYLSDEDARFLVEQITKDGVIDDTTEFALLINIFQHLRTAPEEVIVLALEAVKETVLGGGTVLFGPERRRPGVIDAADVELIRSVIFASGSGGSLTITRREAMLVFELNDRTVEKNNAPEWQTLFVQAIAHYLMFPRGAPAVPRREEAARRERWLEERRGTGRLLAETLRSLNGHIFARTLGDMVAGPRDKGVAAAEAERLAEGEAFARETIDESEAAWLLAQVEKDGILHDNERALLAFIKENSPRIHSSLDALFEEAGLAP
jgi:hypothetical protein